MANTNHVNRITLFKIPNEEDRQKLLELYRGMPLKAVKSTFASVDDMAYYDNECAAHAELKAFAKSVNQGAMMIYFQDELK
ncbi:hypothetical protein ACHAPB_003717 [Verticillium nonalfalfae]